MSADVTHSAADRTVLPSRTECRPALCSSGSMLHDRGVRTCLLAPLAFVLCVNDPGAGPYDGEVDGGGGTLEERFCDIARRCMGEMDGRSACNEALDNDAEFPQCHDEWVAARECEFEVLDEDCAGDLDLHCGALVEAWDACAMEE